MFGGISMADEEKILETEETEVAAAKPRKHKKAAIIWGTIIGILAVLGIGFGIWHGTVHFCGAICHTPMDSYVAGYNAEKGTMLINKHAVQQDKNGKDIKCLTCHPGDMATNIHQATAWVSGNYPYKEDTGQVGVRYGFASYDNSGITTNDGFCINDACHTIDQLEVVNNIEEYQKYQPHSIYMGMDECGNHMGQLDCGNCHRMHEPSVMYCTQCHEDAPVPAGWVAYDEDTDTRDVQRVEAQ